MRNAPPDEPAPPSKEHPSAATAEALRWQATGFPWSDLHGLTASLTKATNAQAVPVLRAYVDHLKTTESILAGQALLVVASTLGVLPSPGTGDRPVWADLWAAFEDLALPLSLPQELFMGVISPLASLASYPNDLGMGPTATYLGHLVRFGADVHRGGPMFERQGQRVQPVSPLHVAVAVRNDLAVHALLDLGADPYRPAGEDRLTAQDLMLKDGRASMLAMVTQRDQRVLQQACPDVFCPGIHRRDDGTDGEDAGENRNRGRRARL